MTADPALEALRFPLGRFKADRRPTEEKRRMWIAELAAVPDRMRAAVAGLAVAQLDTPYRPGGWTVRQVVHHVADSHVSGYARCKLALTEEAPEVKTFDQDRWAELADGKAGDVEWSLALLDALHRRWDACLRGLRPEDFARSFRHPEWGATTLDVAIQMYAWHGTHHAAQITRLRERMGW